MHAPVFLRVFAGSTILMTVLRFLVNGAQFRDVNDLLKVACSSKYSSPNASFRWMILLSVFETVPQAMVDAVKHMECDYEVRTVESVLQWNTSYLLPHEDYKVIALGLSIGDLRHALSIYVSFLLFQVHELIYILLK